MAQTGRAAGTEDVWLRERVGQHQRAHESSSCDDEEY
jgi:hypothetical protein